ncbi:MAG: redoxin domain-containing protein [Verrucomicrobiales bacterium]|nr:redoxin domain-containing protein [Verrucomicrobiales bacterium]
MLPISICLEWTVRTTSLLITGEDILAIIFTCNHCPTAQAYEGRIIQAVKDYAEKSVDFVAISPNSAAGLRLNEQGFSIVGETLEDIKIHPEFYGFNFPYLYDGESQEASRAYGVIATPHVYLFDKERKLRYHGRLDDDEKGDNIKSQDMRDGIDALLAGNEIPNKETRLLRLFDEVGE